MIINTVKYIFLGIALLLLAVTVGYFFVFEQESSAAKDQYYLQSVQSRLAEHIQIANTELAPLAISIPTTQGRVSRTDLPETTHPYYLYDNGNTVYWSDNSFVPEFEQIKDITGVGTITENGYKFVVVRHPVSSKNIYCVSLIPIYQTEFSGKKFSDLIFSISPEKESDSALGKDLKPINDTTGKTLFYLKAPQIRQILQPTLPANTLKLLGITMLFIGLFCFIQIGSYIKEHHFGRAFLLLSFFLLAIRWLMLVQNEFLVGLNPKVFDPLVITDGRWATSLGDRLINCVILLILMGFLATYFYRSTVYYFIRKSTDPTRSFFAVSSVVLSFAVSYLVINELGDILFLSGGEYSYGLLTNFTYVKIVLFLYYLSLSILYFLTTHCCIYLFTQLFSDKVKGVLHWLYGSILSLILLSIIDGFSWLYLLVGAYFLFVFYYQLSRNFYVFRFKTSLYFFLAAFTFAIVGTFVLQKYLNYEKKYLVQEIRNTILSTTNAPFEESVLKKVTEIENDDELKVAIQQEVLTRERVVEIIKSNYFEDFATNYSSNINVFGSAGENLDILADSADLEEWQRKLTIEGIPVGNGQPLFKFDQGNGKFIYWAAAQITSPNGELLGSLLIELVPANGVDTANQLAEGYLQPKSADNTEYSFALYDSTRKLIESKGSFVYPDNSSGALTSEVNELSERDFHHYSFKDAATARFLVISLPDRGWLTAWGNLSFLFLISVLAISVVLIIYSFYYVYRKRSQMNFTTRIQLSLNTAFILPLLLVLIIAISVVGATLKQNQASGFRENTSSLASTVQLLATDLAAGRMTEAYFRQEVSILADNAGTNLTLYNAFGKREFVSKNASFILPAYLNPSAFESLIDKNERQVLVDENTYEEAHLASYVNISPVMSTEKMILGIPHIGSKNTLEKQLQAVISSILNIFILLFAILLLASYFVSSQLTNPIRTVTSHLRKTNLDKLDEPLPLAETSDEMGILVRAYNRMLKKLEESKIALSNSEKQTAWREMAKQVAHEIKNPLTPMKLSIQQLQRTLPADDPKSKLRIERALNSLNEQIDNISEIANSFSEFAKMPVPRSEEFDLVEIIQKTADLYMTNKVSDIQLSFIQPKLMVRGDRQLMSRVLTNLIINGLQSVPLDRRPRIDISAYKNDEDTFAIVEVKDNGAGVPDEIIEKVFIPNFSTKVGGSGLGLALAKRGIEHGGGNIWFETDANTGTIFYVDLPLAH